MGQENEDIIIDDIVETNDEEGNDLTDWKAEALKFKGIAQRAKTKLEKSKSEPVKEEQKKEEKKGFDYAEKAYLKASGLSSKEDMDLAYEVMQSTGKSLDDVLDSKYFQAELKERRELKSSKDALPETSKRATSSTRDSVDYWLAKGELPPTSETELRRKVLNARIHKETDGRKFYNQK